MNKKQLLDTAFKNAKAQWRTKGAILPKIILTDKGLLCPGGLDIRYAFTNPNDEKVMTIYLNTDWKNYSNEILLQILLHEIGHAIKGNWEHSKNPEDVMYPSVDGKHCQLTANDMKWAK